MKTMKRPGSWLTLLGLGLTAIAGCQTYFPSASVTLPSGHYLEHPPQYIPPSPPFPLARELASMEAQKAGGLAGPAVAPAAIPAPVPMPGPVPLPPPGP